MDGDQTFVVHPRPYCWCCMFRLEMKVEEFRGEKYREQAGRCDRTVEFTTSLGEVAHHSSVISRELRQTAAQEGICVCICGSSGGNCARFGVN